MKPSCSGRRYDLVVYRYSFQQACVWGLTMGAGGSLRGRQCARRHCTRVSRPRGRPRPSPASTYFCRRPRRPQPATCCRSSVTRRASRKPRTAQWGFASIRNSPLCLLLPMSRSALRACVQKRNDILVVYNDILVVVVFIYYMHRLKPMVDTQYSSSSSRV